MVDDADDPAVADHHVAVPQVPLDEPGFGHRVQAVGMLGNDRANGVVVPAEVDVAAFAVAQYAGDHAGEQLPPRRHAGPVQRAEGGAADRVELTGRRAERLVVAVALGRCQGVPHDAEVVGVDERHEEVVGVAQFPAAVRVVHRRHGHRGLFPDESEGGQLGRHRALLVRHHLDVRRRRDLQHHVGAVPQADPVGDVEPAVPQLVHPSVTDGHLVAAVGALDHRAQGLERLAVLGDALHRSSTPSRPRLHV